MLNGAAVTMWSLVGYNLRQKQTGRIRYGPIKVIVDLGSLQDLISRSLENNKYDMCIKLCILKEQEICRGSLLVPQETW